MDKDIVILVVEDDAIQREVVLDQLEIAGYEEAIGMEDGVEAYSYIEENPADLIISDWSMPNMDGLELLKQIRSNPTLQNLHFIMLTANEEVTIKAMDAGASGFLSKPTNPAKLIETIGKIFE